MNVSQLAPSNFLNYRAQLKLPYLETHYWFKTTIRINQHYHKAKPMHTTFTLMLKLMAKEKRRR
jgi:hypothetical protein